MAWSDIADRALQRAISTFKTAATYIPADSSPSYSLDGVYSKPFQSLDPQSGAVVSSVHPTFGVRLADMSAAPAEGDTLTIASGIGTGTWRVLDSQPDGEGGSTLSLHKVG